MDSAREWLRTPSSRRLSSQNKGDQT